MGPQNCITFTVNELGCSSGLVILMYMYAYMYVMMYSVVTSIDAYGEEKKEKKTAKSI